MVVPPPARTIGCLDLQHSIHNAERILNNRIVRALDPVANQFEKPSVDDVVGGKLKASVASVCVERPKSALVRLLSGGPKFGWLKRLKN
jgi:hypothetical protein